MSKLQEYAEEQGLVETAVATVAETPEGWGGDFDQSDFAIPNVKIVQASSDEVKNRTAQPGEFLSSEGGTVEFIDFVPLHIQGTRDYYNAEARKGLCYSGDRRIGHPRDRQHFANAGVELEEGETLPCAVCPFSNMDVREKVACKKGYTITAYDITTDSPFLFRVKGAAVNVFKNRFAGAVAMGRALPWARAFQMTSALKNNGGNSWFGPVLQPIQRYGESEMAFWKAMASGYVAPPEAPVDADDVPYE